MSILANNPQITSVHVERGRAMRAIVNDDIIRYGISFEAAVQQLSDYLGISQEAVKLAIAIANEADRPRLRPLPPCSA